MTTIAFDGTAMAADRRMSTDNGVVATRKIVLAGRWWYGGCGEASDCELIREWLAAGAKPEERPQLSQGEKSHGIAVDAETCAIHLVDGKYPTLVPVKERTYAVGSGGDFARAAMLLGKSASEAVGVAARLDPSTGNGVDIVRVKRAPRKR